MEPSTAPGALRLNIAAIGRLVGIHPRAERPGVPRRSTSLDERPWEKRRPRGLGDLAEKVIDRIRNTVTDGVGEKVIHGQPEHHGNPYFERDR